MVTLAVATQMMTGAAAAGGAGGGSAAAGAGAGAGASTGGVSTGVLVGAGIAAAAGIAVAAGGGGGGGNGGGSPVATATPNPSKTPTPTPTSVPATVIALTASFDHPGDIEIHLFGPGGELTGGQHLVLPPSTCNTVQSPISQVGVDLSFVGTFQPGTYVVRLKGNACAPGSPGAGSPPNNVILTNVGAGTASNPGKCVAINVPVPIGALVDGCSFTYP